MVEVICDMEFCRHNIDGECERYKIQINEEGECEDYDTGEYGVVPKR